LCDELDRRRGLAQPLDQQPGVLEGASAMFERVAPAKKRHAQPVALDGFLEAALTVIGLPDLKHVVLLRPCAGVGQRVRHTHAQPPASHEDPAGFCHRNRHVNDVYQAVVGHDQVSAGVGQRQPRRIGYDVAALGVGRLGVTDQGG
jgi:hypothetical protein